jgi:hypothetical protein
VIEPGVLRRVTHEVLLFSLYLFVALVFTWPLLLNLHTALPDLGDPLLNTWIIDWDIYAFTHAPAQLFNAPIYYPARYALAYSENLVGIALVGLPLRLSGAPPLVVYNLLFIFGFAFSGYAGSVLARSMHRTLPAAVIAGILLAFSSYKFDHLAHIQIIWTGWLALLFASVFHYFNRPSSLRAVGVGAAFVMNGLTNIHWLLFGTVALAATLAVLFIAQVADRQVWMRLIIALVIAGFVLLPFLLPYRFAADLYGMRRNISEVSGSSARWSDWLVASPRSALYSQITPNGDRPERHLFPGILPLLLTAFAFVSTPPKRADVTTRQSWRVPRPLLRTIDALIIYFCIGAYLGTAVEPFTLTVHGHVIVAFDESATPLMLALCLIAVRLALQLPKGLAKKNGDALVDVIARSRFSPTYLAALTWIAIGVMGSLGLNGFFHVFLYKHVDAFHAIRTPARWAMISYLGLAVWAALGADAIINGKSGARRDLLIVMMFALTVLDVAPNTRWEQMLSQPPVYAWLSDAHVQGPILELPMSGWIVPFPYLLGWTTHHVPIMNGTSGFEPPLHATLRTMTSAGEFNDVFSSLLKAERCELLIVHGDWLDPVTKPALFKWLTASMSTRELSFVGRMDGGINGDYVFRFHNGTDSRLPALNAARDKAGYTPAEELQRFLAGETTYNSSMFGFVDSPAQDQEIHGAMTVSGWALCPNGLSAVNVLVDSGQFRYSAHLRARPDISSKWPWYANTPLPGFVAVLPQRPKGLHRSTDFQIELVDKRENTTRLPDRLITWD